MGLSISTTHTTHKLNLKRDRRKQQQYNKTKIRHRKNIIPEQNINPQNVTISINKQNIHTIQTNNKMNMNMENSRIEKKPISSSLTNDNQMIVSDNAYQIKILKQMKQTNNTNSYLKTDQEKYQPYKYKTNKSTQQQKIQSNPQSNQQITILKNSNFTYSTNVNSNYQGLSNTKQYIQRSTSIQESRIQNMQKKRSNSNFEKGNINFNSPKGENQKAQFQNSRINSIQQTRKDLQEIQNRKKKDILNNYQKNEAGTPRLTNNVYQGRSGSKSSFVKDNVCVETITSRDVQLNNKNQQKIKLHTQQIQVQNEQLTRRISSHNTNKYKFYQIATKKQIKDGQINKIKPGNNSSTNSNKIKIK